MGKFEKWVWEQGATTGAFMVVTAPVVWFVSFSMQAGRVNQSGGTVDYSFDFSWDYLTVGVLLWIGTKLVRQLDAIHQKIDGK